jgi:putative flippase GtrA
MPNSKPSKFILIGLLNTMFGYSAYALLIFFGLSFALALLISTVSGIIFNYFTFGQLFFNIGVNLENFIKFIITYLFIYLLNVSFLHLMINIWNVNSYMSQFLFLIPAAAISWLLMNYWVFKEVYCEE